MLEDCQKIKECEKKLLSEMSKIKLLGDIPLNENDVKKIEKLLKNEIIERNNSAFDRLLVDTPVSVATYMVWKGILSYKVGNYWSSVKNILGIYSISEEIKLGEFFLNFLKRHNLFYWNIEGSHKYVTPILLHGRMPNYCIKEYFEKILLIFIKRYLEYMVDETDIKQELKIQVEYYFNRRKINNRINQLNERNKQLKLKIDGIKKALSAKEEVKKLKELVAKIGDIDELIELPERFDIFHESINRKIKDLKERTSILKKKREKRINELKKIEEKNIIINNPGIVRKLKEAIKDIYILEQNFKTLCKVKEKINGLIREKTEEIFSNTLIQNRLDTIEKINFEEMEIILNNIANKKVLIEDKEKIINQRKLEEKALWGWKLWIIEIILILSGFLLLGLDISLVWAMGTIMINIIVLYKNVKKGKKIRDQKEKIEKEISRAQFFIAENEKEINCKLGDLPIKSELINSENYENLQKLKELKHMLQESSKLEKKRDQLDNSIRNKKYELMKKIGDFSLDSNESIMNLNIYLDRKKKEEEIISKKIEKIKDKLEKTYGSKIKENENKINDIEKKYKRIEEQYKRLGNGNLLAGIKKADAKRKMIQEIGELKERIKASLPDLESIDDIVKLSEGYFDEIIERKNQMEKDLKENEKEINELRKDYEKYDNVFDYIDKPIRRFLIYGKDIAEKFLLESIKLILDDNEAEKKELPDRISKKLLELKRNIDEKDFAKKKNNIRHPYLYFHYQSSEIFIKIINQKIEYSGNIKTIYVQIYNKLDNHLICRNNLNVYVVGKNIIEIKEYNCRINELINIYRVVIEINNRKYFSEDIHCLKDGQPYIFFEGGKGKMFNPENDGFNEDRIWIVIKQGYRIAPENIITETGKIYGGIEDYDYYLLDINKRDCIEIIKNNEVIRKFEIGKNNEEKNADLAGQKIPGVKGDEKEIFTGDMPHLKFKNIKGIEYGEWNIAIKLITYQGLEINKSFKLSELRSGMSIDGNNAIDLDLKNIDIIGEKDIGEYVIRIRGPNNYLRKFAFIFLPETSITFDKRVYYPVNSKKERRKIKIVAKSNHKFKFDIDRSNYLYAQNIEENIDKDEDYIEKTIIYDIYKTKWKIPIKIYIPKIKWRILNQSKEIIIPWSNWVKDVFLSDIQNDKRIFLEVMLPSEIKGLAEIYIGKEKLERKQIDRGLVRYNITKYMDTLTRGNAVEVINLRILSIAGEIDGLRPLLKIRNRWEIKNIRYSQRDVENMRTLNIWWDEEEGTPGKVIRFWKVDEDDGEPKYEINSYEGDQEILIKVEKEKLPPGEYILIFEFEDEWSTNKPQKPRIEGENRIILRIKGNYICQIDGCGFSTKNEAIIREHIKNEHLRWIFPHLNYDELVDYLGNLPSKILKCSYDNFVVKDFYKNPVTQMEEHHNKVHSKEKDANGERLRMSYIPINDVDEIRKYYIKDLPYAYKCIYCGRKFRKFDNENLLMHLFSAHKTRIVKEI